MWDAVWSGLQPQPLCTGFICSCLSPRVSVEEHLKNGGCIICGGNGVRVHSYVYPQPQMVLKHLVWHDGCGMQSEVVYIINHFVERHHSLHTSINYDLSNSKAHCLLLVVGCCRMPLHHIPSRPSSSFISVISSSFSSSLSSLPYNISSTASSTSKLNSIIFSHLRGVYHNPSLTTKDTLSLLSSNLDHQLHYHVVEVIHWRWTREF